MRKLFYMCCIWILPYRNTNLQSMHLKKIACLLVLFHYLIHEHSLNMRYDKRGPSFFIGWAFSEFLILALFRKIWKQIWHEWKSDWRRRQQHIWRPNNVFQNWSIMPQSWIDKWTVNEGRDIAWRGLSAQGVYQMMPRWTTIWENFVMNDEACHTCDIALSLMLFVVHVLEPTPCCICVFILLF